MNWKDLLIKFYESSRLEDMITKICPNKRYREDLKQELILHFMQMEEEKITKLLESGEIYYYSAKFLKIQYHSSTSTFFKNYRNFYELDSNFDIPHNNDEDLQKVVNEVDRILDTKVDFFSAFLFREYYYEWFNEEKNKTIKGNSYRKIEEKYSLDETFKMDHMFIYNNIKKTFDVVKKELNK